MIQSETQSLEWLQSCGSPALCAETITGTCLIRSNRYVDPDMITRGARPRFMA